MSRRRLLWIVPLCLVVIAGLYSAWLAWQLQRDLRDAEGSAQALKAAWQAQDPAAQQRAAADLRESSDSARSRADGAWWGALTHLPVVGDDAAGVRALSRSLDILATDAVDPLSDAVDGLDGVVADGRVDLKAVQGVQQPVTQAHEALVRADGELDRDSSGYVGALRTRYDDFADLVHGLRTGLAAAQTATEVAPAMLGADGPRDYLVIFQNNAEIRSTGGLPGSWALVHAEDGSLRIDSQGSANDFPVTQQPVRLLSKDEIGVYGRALGQYFHDAGFTPDFPRAAQLWDAHWRARYPERPLDGVVALDPVALSYLLEGTGPVTFGSTTLTAENVVREVLSRPYLDLPVAQQDAYFQAVARAVFGAVTGKLASPVAFVQGASRAAGEGRLLVASFDDQVEEQLSGTRVAGELAGDDGATPHLDVGLNDLTGSKMSYYLRYEGEVDATGCSDGVQTLSGAVTLRQVVSPERAAKLPDYVTGGGAYGTDPGSQFVMVRVYGPWGGSLDRLRINGRDLEDLRVHQLAGRPVANVDVLLSSRKDVLVTWEATTGPGQTAAGVLGMTPSVVPGQDRHTFASAC